MDPGNRKAVMAALLANAGIAVGKFIGFAVTGASSMLAEGVHSVADSGNQALLLWGGSAAQKPATPDHPFGYGRERYFWAFVVALVLFSLGGVFAVYEGVHKLQHPEPLNAPVWAVGILAAGIIMEGFSFRTAVVAARPLKGGRSWWQFITRTKNPELPVVLLEDLGALLGLVIALVCVSMAWVTGDVRWDAVGSLVIGGLLGVIAVVLALEMKSLLIGEAASEPHREAIGEAVAGAPSVRSLISVRTQHIGPEQLLVGCKVDFDDSLGFEQLTHAIDGVEAAVRARLPELQVIIYVEPDVLEMARREAGRTPPPEA